MTPIILRHFYRLSDTEGGGARIHVDKRIALTRFITESLPRVIRVQLFMNRQDHTISLTDLELFIKRHLEKLQALRPADK